MADRETDEKIVCSAIKIEGVDDRYDDVYLGLRHFNCFGEIKRRRDLLGDSDEWRVKCLQNAEQGFITTKNRFVDRIEGLAIATKYNQVINKFGAGDELFSECLY